MSTTKICSSCGANNDTILKNCVYCHSQLPTNEEDIKSISDEDLLMACGEWIGKFEGLVADPDKLQNSKMIARQKGNFMGAIMQLGVRKEDRAIEYSSYLEALNRYMTILKIRAISNKTIQPVYEDFRNRFNETKKIGDEIMSAGVFKSIFGKFGKKK